MIVLGIDPGTLSMGYGVVVSADEEPNLVAYGVLTAKPRSPMGERLRLLYRGLEEIIERYGPEEVAVEEPFMAENARSALSIGRAQAVAILAAANRDLPVYQYTPLLVKQMLTDYGRASKEQMQEMVRLQLRLSDTPHPSDAADALAVALCHVRQRHLTELLSRPDKEALTPSLFQGTGGKRGLR
jgi:crossover junction endodeoxyribonuclease RuvC